ncbi:UDP-galactose transporter, putative [Entamoeba dispar SAW760]|uniref:UDP-galactose transporter, putative n=1 Tax=Entamoeba dispar (strain ATCC PRA-260 / SAW760) TaxID=370354 RepID=B0EFX3_ENTDS|nr:UDP-galactose transporter, putative [Entamoeba dispar SAW760]EDR26579.1 UDP-galactose transporter, putative [Entamoeba dispar SAW760]|eukprot:EDR26579.1 UDP-galactose transporter, putative [Entamoeba dispar SAW760]
MTTSTFHSYKTNIDILITSICLVGSFLSVGFFTEYLTKHQFGKDKILFTATSGLVFLQACFSTLGAYILIKITKQHFDIKNVPYKRFIIQSQTYCGAMFFSNKSLLYIDYPTQIITKFCKPITVMLFSIFYTKKYEIRQVIFSIITFSGIAMFMYDKFAKLDTSKYSDFSFIFGLILIVISLVCDGIASSEEDIIAHDYQVPPFYTMIVIIKKPICIDFKEFTQLRRIKLISINVKLNLFQFFTEKNQKFDWVYVNLTQNIEAFINQIDDYEIKKFIIETKKINGINILNKQILSKKVIVCCNEWIEKKEAIVNYQDSFLYSSRKKNINEAMKLYYPYSIELSWLYNENEKIVDLSSFTNIIQIRQQFKPKQQYYYPSSLKIYDGCSLKNIPNSIIYLYLSDVAESIIIPSYIIGLKLENVPHWTIPDNNCVNTLKLITDIDDKLPSELTKLKNMKAMHLTNCSVTNILTVLTRLNKMRLSQCRIGLNSTDLPSSLTSIICRNCKTKSCFLPSSLVSLQILGMKNMEETPFKGFIFHNKMQLQQLSNDSGIDITKIPTTITYLSIKNYSNNELLNLKNLSLLNILGISNSSNVTIIVPSKLKELYCFSSIVTIQNPNESLLEGMYFKSCKLVNWSSVPKLIKYLQLIPPISFPLNQKDYPNLKFHKIIVPNSQPDLFISQGLPNIRNERRPLISKMDIKIIDN